MRVCRTATIHSCLSHPKVGVPFHAARSVYTTAYASTQCPRIAGRIGMFRRFRFPLIETQRRAKTLDSSTWKIMAFRTRQCRRFSTRRSRFSLWVLKTRCRYWRTRTIAGTPQCTRRSSTPTIRPRETRRYGFVCVFHAHVDFVLFGSCPVSNDVIRVENVGLVK